MTSVVCFAAEDDVAKTKPGAINRAFQRLKTERGYLIDVLVKLAREKKGEGYETYSIYALVEVMRFGARGPGTNLSVDNNVRADLAVEIEHRAPDLQGFFRHKKWTRQAVAA
jgi:hypothetical protein